MAPKPGTAEAVIARIAGGQHGVATRRQLLDAGLTVDQVRQRLENRLLIAVHRGVYRVGHCAPSVTATYIAAVLACGPGALLCGRAAAFLYRLIRGRAPAPTVLTANERHLAGVRTRQSRAIDPRDATRLRGIPVTTVPRTLVDLAAVLSLDDLARACHEAGVHHETTPRQVEAVLARRPNSRGAANLRLVLGGGIRVNPQQARVAISRGPS